MGDITYCAPVLSNHIRTTEIRDEYQWEILSCFLEEHIDVVLHLFRIAPETPTMGAVLLRPSCDDISTRSCKGFATSWGLNNLDSGINGGRKLIITMSSWISIWYRKPILGSETLQA